MSNPNQQLGDRCIGIEVKCELNCLGSHSQAHFRAIRASESVRTKNSQFQLLLC